MLVVIGVEEKVSATIVMLSKRELPFAEIAPFKVILKVTDVALVNAVTPLKEIVLAAKLEGIVESTSCCMKLTPSVE